jgi:hypothetical protein
MFPVSKMSVVSKVSQRLVDVIADRMINFTSEANVVLVIVDFDVEEVVVVNFSFDPHFFVVVVDAGRQA